MDGSLLDTMVLLAALGVAALAIPNGLRVTMYGFAGSFVASMPWDRLVRRTMTRAHHSAERFAATMGSVGRAWIPILLSMALFAVVVVVAAVVDWRMLTSLRGGIREVRNYLWRGARTFYLILLDHQTPQLARFLLLGGFAYWLTPLDIWRDSSLVPGFVDDVAVAVLCSRGFLYLCPDGVVVRHVTRLDQPGARRS